MNIKKWLTFRPRFFLAFLLLLVTEIIIGAYIHDSFIRPYVGDILVVILLFTFFYSFLRVPKTPLIIGIFIFSVLVEILQYFKIADIMGIQNKMLRIIIGTSFSWWDILCYGIGAIIMWFLFKQKNDLTDKQ